MTDHKKMTVEKVPLSSIRGNPLNNEIFNEVPGEKRAALKDYIKREGLLKPIIINGDGVILAGHVRFEICRELGYKEVPVQRVHLDRKKEEELLIKDNLLSRSLTPIEVAKAGIHLEAIAKKWKRNGRLLRDEIAKQLGISKSKYDSIKAILASGDPGLVDKVNNGQLSVARAYAIVRHERGKAKAREKAKESSPRFRLVNEDPAAALANSRPKSCDVILINPPEDLDPVIIGLAMRALKPSGHLGIMTETNFRAIATAQDCGFNLIFNACVLGKSRNDGKITRNSSTFAWLSLDPNPKIKVDRLSTTWDLRIHEDCRYEAMNRVINLLAEPGNIVIHLYGTNVSMDKLSAITRCHIFAVQPDKSEFAREKLGV